VANDSTMWRLYSTPSWLGIVFKCSADIWKVHCGSLSNLRPRVFDY
jgi:hypothetical protein